MPHTQRQRVFWCAHQAFCGSRPDSVHGGGLEQVHGLLYMGLSNVHLQLHPGQGLADAHNGFQLAHSDGHRWHLAISTRCAVAHLRSTRL